MAPRCEVRTLLRSVRFWFLPKARRAIPITHSKEEASIPRTWHYKIPPTRNGRETEESRSLIMKKLRVLSLVGITSIALVHAVWAAGHGGGGGGFGGGGFSSGGGGHAGGGGATSGGGHFSGGGGFRSAGPGFNGRPGYYYSPGMRFTNSRAGQFRSPVGRSTSFARP